MSSETVFNRPRVAVFGLGDYYDKLKNYIWSYLEPVSLIDTKPVEYLHLDVREKTIFTNVNHEDSLAELLGTAQASLVLTPHQHHAYYTQKLLDLGQKVFVEKPFAVSKGEIEAIEQYVKRKAPIYFSDFYVDVRATPLLWFVGRVRHPDWRVALLREINDIPQDILRLGKINRIYGRILEKYTIHREAWLHNRPYGGVVFDMMIHLLALLRFIFPNQEFEIQEKLIKYHKKGSPPAVYEDLAPTPESSEAYARVKGLLQPLKVPVCLEVGKNYNQNSRSFTIQGERGYCKQAFVDEHPLLASIDGTRKDVTMVGDRYELAVRAFLEWFNYGSGVYGWDWSSWAVRKILEINNHTPKVKVTNESKTDTTNTSKRRIENFYKPDSPVLVRRDFLKKGGLWILGCLVSGAAGGFTSAIVARRAEEIASSQGDIETRRLELISEVINIPKRLLLVPGTSHIYGRPTLTSRELGYPHDLRALSPFRRLFPGAAQVLDTELFQEEVRPSDTLMTTGSPVSGKLAMEVLTWWKQTGDKREMAWDSSKYLPIVQLPYHFVVTDEQSVRVCSGMEGGRDVRKLRKGLLDERSGTLLYPHTQSPYTDSNGWLKTDFLLVTKVPLSSEGPDVILITGGHGPSTQAIELLFKSDVFHLADLETLASCLKDWRYYQFVLEISQIRHNQPMSEANSISISPYAPPRPVKLKL